MTPSVASIAELAALVQVGSDPWQGQIADRVERADGPRALASALGTALYHELHCSRVTYDGPLDAEASRDLVSQLKSAVDHRHHLTRGPIERSGSGHVVVRHNGVRVLVPAERLAKEIDGLAYFDIGAVRSDLSPGFLVVDGSAETPDTPGDLVRVYVHLESGEAAVPVWRAVLRLLEDAHAAYRVKVLSNVAEYPRRDALVVYLWPASRWIVPEIVSTVVGHEGVATDTSPFARPLGPGVAMAFEPSDARPLHRGLSFGQHRARLVADVAIEAHRSGRPVTSVAAELSSHANVDPQQPFRNLSSQLEPATQAVVAVG